MTSETTAARTIPAKPFKVKGPDGKFHYVYAQTHAGAIRDVKASIKPKEEIWSAELATVEDMFVAFQEKAEILNAPASIARPAQTDAFVDSAGE